MLNLLKLAGKIAMPTDINDMRNFYLGAIGIRKDGVLVSAKNGAVQSSDVELYQTIPTSHAECRALRKMGYGGILYVSRIAKGNGKLAMARPCETCQVHIRSMRVKKVYYSINSECYGIWDPVTDKDSVFRSRSKT